MSANGAVPRTAELLLRRCLLAVVVPTALVAVCAGLARLGLLAVPFQSNAAEHGPLLVVGVFGTLVALERAVALGSRWGYVAPACGALAAIALLSRSRELSALLGCASALGMVGVNLAIVKRRAESFTFIMLLGSLGLAGGSLLWAQNRSISEVAPAWVAFFALTIFGERLELSRLGAPPRWALMLAVTLAHGVALSAGAALFGYSAGLRAMGGFLALLAVWGLCLDLARRTLHMQGLPRFSALAVLLGTGWLLISGLGLVVFGLPPAGPVYDAILHGVFVGFVLSMVFAHAPIILPAVARVSLPFRHAFYFPLAVLHTGLVVRVVGDMTGSVGLRQAGGIANGLALVAFALTALLARATFARARN